MRTLKRTLCLVLAMVMVLGMFGIASATSFKDDAKVQYNEAVDVMTGIGAINGMGDGTFNPAGNVTRAQAAKMVAYAVLGENIAKTLPVSASSFKDVDSNFNWAIPSIEYLVKVGVINGRGNGTFDPNGKVTAYEIAKMLLCAAGYGKKGEFTGNSWALNVAITAQKQGVFAGSKTTDRNAAATREECALYCFNGLTSVVKVVWDKDKEAYESAKLGTVTDNNGDKALQIAEEVYPSLKKAPVVVDGVESYRWMYKNQPISGVVADVSVLATSTDGTTYANLTLNTSSKYVGHEADAAVSYYYNGIAIAGMEATNTSNATIDYKVNDIILVGSIAAGGDLYKVTTAITKGAALNSATNITDTTIDFKADGKKGVVVSFYDTNSNGKYDVVSFTQDKVVELTGDVKTVTEGAITKVTVPGISAINKLDSKNVIGYEGLKKGDIVLYHTNGVQHFITKCSSFTGTLNAYNTTAAVAVVNGKQYKMSEITTYSINANKDTLLGKADTTFYTDKGGNIAYAVPVETTVSLDNTLFLKDAQNAGYTKQANVIMADGTSAIITLGKIDTTAVVGGDDISAKYKHFYTFTKNDNGTYNLKAVANETIVSDYNATTQKVFETATADFFFDKAQTAQGKLATSSTVFVVETATAGTYKAYTGINNVPTVKAKASGTVGAVLCDADGYAIFAVAYGVTTDASTSSMDYVFAATPATEVYNADGNYYTYLPAVVNGTIGKADAVYNSTLVPGMLQAVNSYENGRVKATTTTGTLLIDSVYDITDFTFNGTTVSYTGDTTSSFITTDDCKYFLYDVTDPKNPTLTASSAADIAALDGEHYAIQGVKASKDDSRIAQLYVTVYPASVDASRAIAINATVTGCAKPLTLSPDVAITSENSASGTAVAPSGYSAGSSETFRFATTDPYAVNTGFAVNTATGATCKLNSDITVAGTGKTVYGIGYYAYPFVNYQMVFAAVTVS